MNKERPIIFSGPMVRAILEGRKTQTRRLVKGVTDPDLLEPLDDAAFLHSPNCGSFCDFACGGHEIKPPYPVGTRLWVRETWGYKSFKDAQQRRVIYKADTEGTRQHDKLRWRPSIHLHRDRSRIDLEVTGVRVQHVQDISEADCAAEGMTTKLCAEVLSAAAGRHEPQTSYYVRYEDRSESDGHRCLKCCEGEAKKNKAKGPRLVAEDCPETDGPAYCDDCQQVLFVSLTAYGIERELFMEGDEDPLDVQRFAATGMDAAIAAQIAGGIGDLRDQHKPRLNKIGYAALWDSINGRGSWASNPWVWCYTFKRIQPAAEPGGGTGGKQQGMRANPKDGATQRESSASDLPSNERNRPAPRATARRAGSQGSA